MSNPTPIANGSTVLVPATVIVSNGGTQPLVYTLRIDDLNQTTVKIGFEKVKLQSGNSAH